jgi:hypothetical protein
MTDTIATVTPYVISKAEVRLFDEDRAAGGFHTGISVGYHW